MYTAAIFHIGVPLNDIIYNTKSGEDAVDEFNTREGLVTLEDHQPSGFNPAQMDRVAATAKLVIKDNVVIAKIKVIDTPCGRIAEELIKYGALMVAPIITGKQIGGTVIIDRIPHLIFGNADMIRKNHSDLAKMKDWINNDLKSIEMFKVVKHDK